MDGERVILRPAHPPVRDLMSANWLVKAEGLLLSQYLVLHPRGTLDWKTAQAALDAQYGKGVFQASTHGNALQVQRVRAALSTKENERDR